MKACVVILNGNLPPKIIHPSIFNDRLIRTWVAAYPSGLFILQTIKV